MISSVGEVVKQLEFSNELVMEIQNVLITLRKKAQAFSYKTELNVPYELMISLLEEGKCSKGFV